MSSFLTPFRGRLALSVMVASGMLAACGSPATEPSPEPTSTAAVTPTVTVAPGPAPTPRQTATPQHTATAQTTLAPVPLPEAFINHESGFQIRYPEGWTVQAIDFATIIAHPVGSSITIATEPTDGVNLEEYLAVTIDEFTLGVSRTGGSFEQTSNVKLEGREAYRVTGRALGAGVVPDIAVTILIAVVQDRGYFITAAVRESLAEQHQPSLNSMLASLAFFDPSLTSAPDDHGDTPGVATEISVGETRDGQVETLLDIDYFRFTGTEGVTYEVQVLVDTLENSLLQLLSQGGSCLLTVGTNFGNTDTVVRWRVPVDDTYHFSVGNAAGTSTGSYRVRLSTTEQMPTDDHGSDVCVATALEIGEEVPGVIEVGIGADLFRFQAEEGVTYAIAVSPGTLAVPLFGLWDADGATLLEANQDLAGTEVLPRLTWTAGQTDRYYVSVTNVDGTSTGSYVITVLEER